MAKTEEKPEQETLAEVIKAIDSVEVEPGRHLSIQLDRTLRDATCAALAANKAASVTLKITVKPNADRRVAYAADISQRLPRPPLSAAVLYADADGSVHRSDPAQRVLAFTPSVVPFTNTNKDN